MDKAGEVNQIAKGLKKHMSEIGYELSEHEAQALSVAGLMAAADCRILSRRLEPELKRKGISLMLEILEAGPESKLK